MTNEDEMNEGTQVGVGQEEPVGPVQPDMPVQPDAPPTPVQPDAPPTPVQPDTPCTPVQPDAPPTPVQPDVLVEPDFRVQPDAQGPPPMTDAPFDYMDIVAAIEPLSLCSGPGPDGISAILLKKPKSQTLKNIFQHSMDNGKIPEILKLGFICPILKPNSSREKAASWRPVSLTSHIVKTFERVLRRQLVNHIELNNLMDQNQHGSRGGKSCLSQLLEHHDEILRKLEEGENVDVIYTDFEKAYEKVDHFRLLSKMKN